MDEAEARKFAKENGAFFKLTSAVSGIGIDEIFHNIGCKLFDPNYEDKDEMDNDYRNSLPGNKENNNSNKNNNSNTKNNDNNENKENNEEELVMTKTMKLDKKKTIVEKKKKCCL